MSAFAYRLVQGLIALGISQVYRDLLRGTASLKLERQPPQFPVHHPRNKALIPINSYQWPNTYDIPEAIRNYFSSLIYAGHRGEVAVVMCRALGPSLLYRVPMVSTS